jgi:hypothetical protein
MTSQPDLSCFHSDYQAARQELLDRFSRYAVDMFSLEQKFIHPVAGPDALSLYQDHLWISQSQRPEQILVLISGTHGVEGFAGSAIQCHLLPLLYQLLQENSRLGVLLIHALNPWGFAWLRRYDHEGIDLNRNFIDFRKQQPKNSGYEVMHDDLFCNANKTSAEVLRFWESRLGDQAFIDTITRGQYSFVDGVFYGGSSKSWSRQIIEKLEADTILKQAKRIAVIDLHTGLGPFAYGEVINDHHPGTAGFEWACRWYGEEVKSALLGESCSTPKSGLLDYFWHSLLGDRGCFVTLEYGTYEINQLLEVSCEEQRYHNLQKLHRRKRDLKDKHVTDLLDFFYPRDRHWREQVLIRSTQVASLAIQGILR